MFRIRCFFMRNSQIFPQATLETPAYFKRLGITWLGFFSIIGGPIAYQTFDPAAQARARDIHLELAAAH